jgi:hypothetical protein
MRAGCHRTSALLLLAALLLPGCRHNTELLESELRAREREARELREEVARLEFHNEALQRGLTTLGPDGCKLPPEAAAQIFTLHRITLGRSTGGYDQDHQLGDEALQVVLEPRDGDDHVIKAPGTVHVTALEISPEGLKTPFSSWTVPPEQLRGAWKNGFFTTGYVLVLPWQKAPHCERVRVVARLETADGRLFETDRDVRVVLRPEILRERPPEGLPAPPTVLPLPAPRPLNAPPLEGGPLLPTPGAGVRAQPARGWQPVSLEGAVQLHRPLPAEGE